MSSFDAKFDLIMARLDQIEKLVQLNNPSRCLSAKEQGKLLRDALGSGDKAKIKRATQIINGEV